MSDNALCTPPRLNDSAICLRLAQFLQETEAAPQSTGLAIAVVGIDGELIAVQLCPGNWHNAKPGAHCAFAAQRRDWRKKYVREP